MYFSPVAVKYPIAYFRDRLICGSPTGFVTGGEKTRIKK